MRRRPPLRSAGALLALSAGLLLAAEPKPSPTRHVLAPGGLKLHAEASSESAVVATVPRGATVDLVADAAAGPESTLAGVAGRLRKVRHGKVTGYVFDGYLAPFAAPDPQMKLAGYAERLRNGGASILYEKIDRDWGGYVQIEEAVVLPTHDWREAFLVARILFDIPAAIAFPLASREPRSVYPNPDKESYLWNDELEVVRDASGAVLRMDYTRRGEGGGTTRSLEAHEEGIRISDTAIGD